METLICSYCKQEKPVEDFTRWKTNKWKICKPCLIQYNQRYYQKNRETILERQKSSHKKEYNREYYKRNKEKRNNSYKDWYEKNRDKVLKESKLYYQDNRDRILERQKEYYRKNKEELSEKCKNHRQENQEKYRIKDQENYQKHKGKKLEYAKNYRQSHPEIKRAAESKRRARKAQAPTEPWTHEEIALQGTGFCPYCGKEIGLVYNPKVIHIDHIVPLSRGGSNLKENLEAVCCSCNMKKHDKTKEEFLNENKDTGSES
jgi:hypothetical protein